MKIDFIFVDEKAKNGDVEAQSLLTPTKGSKLAAGFDLVAANAEPIVLKPMERALVPTGIAIALPENYEAQVRPRSGLALKHGVTVLNSPGTIDADYRGEIKALLVNLGSEIFVVERGMRIAQLVVSQVLQAEFSNTVELVASVRGAGGFGSTGVFAG